MTNKRIRRLTREEKWCRKRREQVRTYLARQRVQRGRIGSWPAWHVDPYISVWAVESRVHPGWVGWWVICGDLPTDYISASRIKHPRTALRAFANRWEKIANSMRRGRAHPRMKIGERSYWPQLEPLLRRRAKLLARFANDKKIWKE